MRSAWSYLGAVVVGAFLFASPFLRYGAALGHAHAAHSDHGARYGGHLFMLGDYHLEVVETAEGVELYLSDVMRRPLRPEECRATDERGPAVACVWRRYRSVVALPTGAGSIRYELTPPGGSAVVLKFP